MLPLMDGCEICRRVKSDAEVRSIPIMMLTARRDERDVVAGLELGADDYVKKPFSTEELRARVAVLLRRGGKDAAVTELSEGDLFLDLENESANLRGRELSLSRTEFRLLTLLMERFGRMVTRENLQSSIWNALELDTRALDVQVSRLRKKLEDGGQPPLLVESRRGRGYRLVWGGSDSPETAQQS